MSQSNFDKLCPQCYAREVESNKLCYICQYTTYPKEVPEELREKAYVESRIFTQTWFDRFFEKTQVSFNDNFVLCNAIVKEQFFYKFPVGTVLKRVEVFPNLRAFIWFGNKTYDFSTRINNRYDGKR